MTETSDLPGVPPPGPEHPAGSAAWWDERYGAGDIPWDTGIVPPEVVSLLAGDQVKPGWALDIGCGSGQSSRYLASQGFRVVGLDLAFSALVRAASAARQAEVPAFFCLADATELGFLHVCAGFALDVGCFHTIPPARRPAYIASLAARLMSGASYLLYAFTLSEEAEEEPRGIGPVDIGGFAPHFVLRWVQHGRDRERPSAWYLLERS
jgi:cyclopropane fatty-acyl-phospholipid synthase-like methyltransferase